MRLRNVTGSRDIIAASPHVIHEPEHKKGHWNEVFGNDNPIFIEIGMGKGKFLLEMAKKYPERNFIGIEKYSSVLIRALEKKDLPESENLKNICFIRMEAEYIADVFEHDEVSGIYLNFSDPWPKERHAKRRLPSKEFFARYEKILAKDGHVEFKTDNRPLFEFSLEQVGEAGWQLEASTFDLHNDEALCEGNVMTEYEEKFSGMGHPIHKLIAARQA